MVMMMTTMTISDVVIVIIMVVSTRFKDRSKLMSSNKLLPHSLVLKMAEIKQKTIPYHSNIIHYV